jgi:N-acetylneuraminate synthase
MKPLVIFEIANNHMGSINHATSIIKKFYSLSKNYRKKIDFAIKFQYRDSKTFIHNSYKNSENKHVKRFESTFLTKIEWKKILYYSKKKFKLICTPFDEISIDEANKDPFDYLKIASCSINDWPFLEHFAKKVKTKKIICSLGGASLDDITNIQSFLTPKMKKIFFLYCVAKYPTDPSELNLAFFQKLKKTYGENIKGFSSHEDPDEYMTGAISYSMGARIFEKHIGVETKKIKLNKYSTSTLQMKKWLDHLIMAIDRVGSEKNRDKQLSYEKKQLKNFQRGVYLKKDFTKLKGEKLNVNEVDFQFPTVKGQLTANQFSKFSIFTLKNKIVGSSAIKTKDLKIINQREKIAKIRNDIRYLAAKSNLVIPQNSKLEISHHYGLESFYRYGLTMIELINNKSYCKKYLFLLKNQQHPAQYHKIKKETFLVLFGKVKLKIIKNKKISYQVLGPGEIYTIMPGHIHEFGSITQNGCVIEEISTESQRTDSFYIDKKINQNKNRKSLISF